VTLDTLSDLLDAASEKFRVRKSTLDRILSLERASLYMKTSRVSSRKRLREIIKEEALHEVKKN
jgi:hypothetical protein